MLQQNQTLQQQDQDCSLPAINYTVPVEQGQSLTITALYQLVQPVNVTITSNPTGSGYVKVDGTPITTPQTLNWLPTTTHVLTANTPVLGADGNWYVFQSWDGICSQQVLTLLQAQMLQQNQTLQQQDQDCSLPTINYTVPNTLQQLQQLLQQSTSGLSVQSLNPGLSTGTNITALYQLVQPVNVTVTSDPTGSGYVKVDGTPITTPQTLNWLPGTTHVLTANTPVSGGDGVQYVFQSWGGACLQQAQTLQQAQMLQQQDPDCSSPTINYTVPNAVQQLLQQSTSGLSVQSLSTGLSIGTTFTANYQTQYYLSMKGDEVSPALGWYNSSTSVTISDSNQAFMGWTGVGDGSYTGTDNPANVTMNGPVTEIANLAQVQVTVDSSPEGTGYVAVDGTPISTPQIFNWTVGSTHTLSAQSVVDCGSECQYTFSGWSDGGEQSRQYVATTNETVTAKFTATEVPEVQITIDSDPEGSGFVTISGDNGTMQPVTTPYTVTGHPGDQGLWVATPTVACGDNCQYLFVSWTSPSIGNVTTPTLNYTVPSNSETVTANYFNICLKVTMTVSYQVIGGGTGYSAPTFHYAQDGLPHDYVLTETPTDLQVDDGAGWSVTPNPLDGSPSPTEQWYADPATLIGTASTSTHVFSFQHQYQLTVTSSPSEEKTDPTGRNWYDSGTVVTITALKNTGYGFINWTGSGSGEYTGSLNPVNVTMNGAVSETATFTFEPITEFLLTPIYHHVNVTWAGSADGWDLYWSLTPDMSDKVLLKSLPGIPLVYMTHSPPPSTWNNTVYYQLIPLINGAEQPSVAVVDSTIVLPFPVEEMSVNVLASNTDEIKVRLNYQSVNDGGITTGVQIGEILTSDSTPTPIAIFTTAPVNLPSYHSTGYYIIDYTPTTPLAPGHYQVWFFLWKQLPGENGEFETYMVKVVVTVTVQ
jgi:hypothetical protein